MAEQTRDRHQGIWIPMDPAAQVVTGVEQTGARPGVAVAAQPTGLRFVASGIQRDGDTYDLRAQRAGYPTGQASGLGILARPATSTAWRGYDEPATLTQWRAVVEAELGDPSEPRWPSALPLQSGKLLQLWGAEDSAEEVLSQVYDPTTNTTAAAVRIYLHPTLYASGWEAHPQAIQLPSGRVLCFWIVYRPGGVQVNLAHSDDDGATWNLSARDVLPAALEPNAAGSGATGYQSGHGLAVAYHRLGVVLFLSVQAADTSGALETQIIQYASDSLGSSFAEVARTNPTLSIAGPAYEISSRPTVLPINGGLLLVTGVLDPIATTTLQAQARFLGDPWQAWTSAEYVVVAINTGSRPGFDSVDADLAAVVASNGSIYVAARGSDDIIRVHRSQDAGATWESLARGGVTIDPDSGVYLHRLSGCWYQEQFLLLHQGDATVGTTEPTVGIATLGGWSTVPRPDGTSAYNPGNLAALPNVWVPYTLPDNAGWTLTGTGTVTLTPSGVTIDTTANPAVHSIAPGGTIAQGLTFEVEVTPSSGGIASDQCSFSLRTADGTDEYQVTVRVGTAAILVHDDIAAANIDSVTADTTAGVVIFADMAGGKVRVYWRPRGFGQDRAFQAVAESDALVSDTATPAAANHIEWGGVGIAVAEWHRVSYGAGTQNGEHLFDRSTPRDLTCLHPARSSVYIDRGLRVTPHDGPAYAADEWEIQTAYNYPATALNPRVSPSPSRGWRSTATSSTNTHTWTLAPDGIRLPALVGVLCVGGNFRTANLRRTSGTGAVTTYASIDAASGLTALPFARSGASVLPGGAANGTVYLHQSEAVGWSVDFGGGVVRRVVAQSEGQWGGTGRKAILTLEDETGVAASGTLALVPSTWLAVVPVPIADIWRSIGIEIPTQGTADGDFRAGILWPGSVELFGFPPSWGAGGSEFAGDVEEIEFRDGTGQRIERAPQRQVYTAAWNDPLDQTRISPGGVNPDHIIPWAAGREAVTYQATPTLLRGLLRDLRSGAVPMAWIRRFPQASGTVAIVNRREAIFYGHVTSPINFDHVQGDPDFNEVLRVSNVTCREIR